jgi:prolyl-tRNA synthetase
MRASRYFLATLKEAPADAELVSHKLMVRAGLIRRLAGGIYTWMPLGLRVVRKVEAIVRENGRAGHQLHAGGPTSGLWQGPDGGKITPELLRLKDRHEREFCVGPTHEEVITDIARRDRSYGSYRCIYQVRPVPRRDPARFVSARASSL